MLQTASRPNSSYVARHVVPVGPREAPLHPGRVRRPALQDLRICPRAQETPTVLVSTDTSRPRSNLHKLHGFDRHVETAQQLRQET